MRTMCMHARHHGIAVAERASPNPYLDQNMYDRKTRKAPHDTKRAVKRAREAAVEPGRSISAKAARAG